MGPLTRPAARPHGSTAEVISRVNLVSRQLHAAARHRRSGTLQFSSGVAEREGFEPPIRLPVCRISSAVLSTTQPPLRGAEPALQGPPKSWDVFSQAPEVKQAGPSCSRRSAVQPNPL